MGYRGKLLERQRARELRAESWTLKAIAEELGVAKSSVSLWVRDVEFTPRPVNGARSQRRDPNKLQRRKRQEIEALLAEGQRRVGDLDEREFLVAGAALYAGEGSKGDGRVKFTNSDARLVAIFCAWLRHFFEIDESRTRVHLYLHEELDVDGAVEFWSDVTSIPSTQFGKPYRAVADATIRRTKHSRGCASVSYACSTTHRAIMGLVAAVLVARVAEVSGMPGTVVLQPSGVAQLAERSAVNR
jgi:transcriptional regulator with XRE-family HTH domain